MFNHTRTLLALCLFSVAFVTACGGSSNQGKTADAVNKHAAQRKAYVPIHDVEFNNYNNAQKLYDNPTTIIFCTTTWGNTASPLVTVPVAGKLTSSSTTYFNPTNFATAGETGIAPEPSRSVDGMYHPNPPQYRYGFTPGGQYVDFFNMPTLCTTALTRFQRQQTKISLSLDPAAQQAQQTAEAALRHGDKAGAQRALEGALGQ